MPVARGPPPPLAACGTERGVAADEELRRATDERQVVHRLTRRRRDTHDNQAIAPLRRLPGPDKIDVAIACVDTNIA